jgi:hypothetical protein
MSGNNENNSASAAKGHAGGHTLASSGNNPGAHRVPPSYDRFPDGENWGTETFLGLSIPAWTRTVLKSCLAATVTLYILNQKHLLPKSLSAVVSKTLFYPTLPITVIKRLGKWSTVVDDTVVIGGAPFGFVNFPERLYNDYGVSLHPASADIVRFRYACILLTAQANGTNAMHAFCII